MPRVISPNVITYLHAIQVSFGTGSGDISGNTFRVFLPSREGAWRVKDFGLSLSVAQVGVTSFLVGLQKTGTATFVTEQIQIASLAINTEATANGNDTTIDAGQSLEINVTTNGTATTAPVGGMWIRFE